MKCHHGLVLLVFCLFFFCTKGCCIGDTAGCGLDAHRLALTPSSHGLWFEQFGAVQGTVILGLLLPSPCPPHRYPGVTPAWQLEFCEPTSGISFKIKHRLISHFTDFV